MYDLIIENATLIDGFGNPAQHGSLAVKNGRISALGGDLGTARERIDAQGWVLSPSIVGLHPHFDAQLI